MSVLDDVLARAGASDVDREAWLAERRAGVTATEVRDLAAGRKTVADLLDEKRNGARFTGNKYTKWGKQREPEFVSFAASHGLIAESRVFHHADEPRYLASPDAIGEDLDGIIIGEFKTSKHDLGVGGEHYEKSGYADQMQWQMFVTGAHKCFFAYEVHDDVWEPVPTPIDMFGEWVERDDARIAELRALADEVLTAGDLPTVDGARLSGLVKQYRLFTADKQRLEAHLKDTKHELDRISGEIRALFPTDGGVAYADGCRVRVGAPSRRIKFDSTRFKEAQPEVWAKYTKTDELAGRVTVAEEKTQ